MSWADREGGALVGPVQGYKANLIGPGGHSASWDTGARTAKTKMHPGEERTLLESYMEVKEEKEDQDEEEEDEKEEEKEGKKGCGCRALSKCTPSPRSLLSA